MRNILKKFPLNGWQPIVEVNGIDFFGTMLLHTCFVASTLDICLCKIWVVFVKVVTENWSHPMDLLSATLLTCESLGFMRYWDFGSEMSQITGDKRNIRANSNLGFPMDFTCNVVVYDHLKVSFCCFIHKLTMWYLWL